MKNEFILTGIYRHPELKTLLFVVFFAQSNLHHHGGGIVGMVALILHTVDFTHPMYILLGKPGLLLRFLLCPAAIGPQNGQKDFPSMNATVQFYFLWHCCETAYCLFFSVAMAYDRYVAYMQGPTFSVRFDITSTTFTVIFFPLYRLSCVDPFINELVSIHLLSSVQVSCLNICISISLLTIFSNEIQRGTRAHKPFSTCASHFSSVSLFMDLFFSIYIRPNLLEEGGNDIPAAILFTIVVPLLNPFIYSLRNKEVISVLRKILLKIKSQSVNK
uniref:G-protein coupled receptors family 1 profile domain-containing protein n=1 Tax=Rhinopithecus bieti TaxID=61621 RepID=A0A2K6LLY8_RHIBE